MIERNKPQKHTWRTNTRASFTIADWSKTESLIKRTVNRVRQRQQVIMGEAQGEHGRKGILKTLRDHSLRISSTDYECEVMEERKVQKCVSFYAPPSNGSASRTRESGLTVELEQLILEEGDLRNSHYIGKGDPAAGTVRKSIAGNSLPLKEQSSPPGFWKELQQKLKPNCI